MATFHSSGIVPKRTDLLNSSHKEGVITSAVSFSSLAEIPSGPVALFESSDFNTQETSASLNDKSVMIGSSDSMTPPLFFLFIEKTEAKYLLNMFAISCGLSASVRCGVFASGVLTLFSDEIMSGKFLAFELLFNTFQKRFGCCLMSVSKLLKNAI